MKPNFHRACKMCETEFDTGNASRVYCGDRCSYISLRWSWYKRKHGSDTMTKEHAIEEYGALFDDPLRAVLHNRRAPAIRQIHNYCVAHRRTSFTCEQVNTFGEHNITPQALGHIAKNTGAVRNTGHVEPNATGTGYVTTWCLEIGTEVI